MTWGGGPYVNYLLNIYTHRLVLVSTLFRKFLLQRQQLLKTDQSAENKWLLSSKFKMGHICPIPQPGLGEYYGRGGRKDVGTGVWGAVLWSTLFWTWLFTHKLTALTVICIRLSKDQSNQISWYSRRQHRLDSGCGRDRTLRYEGGKRCLEHGGRRN